MMLFKAMTVAGALLAMSACTDASPDVPAGPSPTTGPLSGAWTGTLSASDRSQTVRIDLTEYAFGSAVTAVGSYMFTSGSNGSGSASGLTIGSQVTLTLAPDRRPACNAAQVLPVGNVELFLTPSESTLIGDALFVECDRSVRGTARLNR
jgi:hypothetical protein